MSFYFLLLLVFGEVFYTDIWSWKNLTQIKAWTGLKDQLKPGAMPTKPQHSPATDQQPEPGSFWDNADLETQPPLLRPAVWAENSCTPYASSTPFPFALYPLVPCMLDCHLSAVAKLCPCGKFWECQALQVDFVGGSWWTRWRKCLESTNSAIKEKGHEEDLPALTASHPLNRSSQNNPSALRRCGLWWFLSSPISLQKSRVSELSGGCLSSTSPLPRPQQMVEDPYPAHLCFQPASSEVQIYTCSWLTRSPRVAAIKRDTVRRYSAEWLHGERAKIDGGSTRENMVWGKTKNREAHVTFISTL